MCIEGCSNQGARIVDRDLLRGARPAREQVQGTGVGDQTAAEQDSLDGEIDLGIPNGVPEEPKREFHVKGKGIIIIMDAPTFKNEFNTVC